MRPLAAYSRRLERKRRLLAARWRAQDLTCLRDNTRAAAPGAVLLFAVIRNEAPRLTWFLDYYRRLGVGHFLIVDNGSTDDAADLLKADDVSLWRTEASYRRARFGVHWLNALMRRHAKGRWCLIVDADEYLVYPHCDTRPLGALTDHLDRAGRVGFGCLLLDLYGRGPVAGTVCAPGEDPVAAAPWFDRANYHLRRDPRYRNLWIQGGPRMRAFFADDPGRAPALNKIPLIRWRPGVCLVSSTHALLPRRYNLTYGEGAAPRLSGALLHAKFLSTAVDKVAEELERAEHFAGGREYRRYAPLLAPGFSLWTPASARYGHWRDLTEARLMSAAGWL